MFLCSNKIALWYAVDPILYSTNLFFESYEVIQAFK